MTTIPIQILLVEDNEGDIFLTREAFEECNLTYELSIARDGNEALDFLFKRNRYENAYTPDLILLDINIPIRNGIEVLKTIKSDDRAKRIPVIMLTTSDSPHDINRAYQNYANTYIVKPLEVSDFINVVSSIESFWMKLVKRPTATQ